jgi:nicotinamidase-related amidase
MDKTALIVVDFQNDYFPGGLMELNGTEAASRNGKSLLDRFRADGAPTFLIQHIFESPEAPFFRPESDGAEIHASVAPTDQDRVIVKHQVNSFQGTPLLEELRSAGAENLVICGAMSHMCIDSATRAASDFGFKCLVAHDACATRDQEFNGAVVPADQVHNAYMAALEFGFADVAATTDILSRL